MDLTVTREINRYSTHIGEHNCARIVAGLISDLTYEPDLAHHRGRSGARLSEIVRAAAGQAEHDRGDN
jgi:hypothetical protein